jgi:hypothetical protein
LPALLRERPRHYRTHRQSARARKRPCAPPVLSTYQKRRRRTEELKAEREDKEKRAAGLLQFAQELKARREAQEKAATERMAKGIKLTYEEWKREVTGE